MRRILSVLSLLVLFSGVAAAQPAKSSGKARVSRPVASPVEPSVLQKLWKQLTGAIRLFDEEEPPPPPPERVHTPVPT